MIGSSPLFNLSEVGKTNYHHSEEETEIIRDTICCTNEALRCLEMKKSAIKLSIVHRQKALESDLKRYHIALAPIQQLPCEILYCIFELHCQQPAKLPFKSCSKPPQITISHVCLAWRRAMLDFQKLWTNIVIAPRWNVPIDKVVDAWLSRAKDLPCSVEFQFAAYSEQAWHLRVIKNFVSR
ncbi:hypothetical protein M378DRAFT_627377, partial [Amanita muscaria Koide BX008]